MDGSAIPIEWHRCTVRWQREDKPALAAWVEHADGRGVGVIVYTTPVSKIRTGPVNVANAYKQSFEYAVSGFTAASAPTLEQAKIDAVAIARASDPELSESRFKTKGFWMKYAITLSDAPAD